MSATWREMRLGTTAKAIFQPVRLAAPRTGFLAAAGIEDRVDTPRAIHASPGWRGLDSVDLVVLPQAGPTSSRRGGAVCDAHRDASLTHQGGPHPPGLLTAGVASSPSRRPMRMRSGKGWSACFPDAGPVACSIDRQR